MTRSKIVQKIIDETPEEVTNSVREYGDRVVIQSDSELVQSKITDLIELWCVLNTIKKDPSALEIMRIISEGIRKDRILKRWNKLHPVSPKSQVLLSNDEYEIKKRKILEKLLA